MTHEDRMAASMEFLASDEEDLVSAIEELKELRTILKAIGGERREDGWYFPFYQHDAPAVWLPLERWVLARKNAAKLLNDMIGRQTKQSPPKRA